MAFLRTIMMNRHDQQIAQQQQIIGRMLPVHHAFEAEAIGRFVAFDAPIREGGFRVTDELVALPAQTVDAAQGRAFGQALQQKRLARAANTGTADGDQFAGREDLPAFDAPGAV